MPAGCWPIVHHDAGQSGATGAAGPAPPLEPVWAVDVGSPVETPVAADDRVFVTTEEPGRSLLTLDAATGAELWAAETRAIPSGAAAAVDGTHYVQVYYRTTPKGSGRGAAVAAVSIDDGTSKAHLDLRHPDSSSWSPVLAVAGDLLYAFTAGERTWMDVIDVSRGSVVQRDAVAGRALFNEPSPTVADAMVFLAGRDGLTALR